MSIRLFLEGNYALLHGVLQLELFLFDVFFHHPFFFGFLLVLGVLLQLFLELLVFDEQQFEFAVLLN